MWLIDVDSLELRNVPDRDLEVEDGNSEPRYRYGILSHRWENDADEPTFEEFRLNKADRSKEGVRKIERCCRIAKSEGLGLLWADTCCIDKRSSAELQESINSMYRYYERAAICFAYLRDVKVDCVQSDIKDSEWFTRGWTLQELLAPSDERFYDRDWAFLGTKHTLAQQISIITCIPEDVLRNTTQLYSYPAAQILSWASGRKTTRIEDRAYSLLGIFDVNLTMLYGEGSKSFLRLQEEILKTWDDPTLFVWKGLEGGHRGLFAASPDAFASSGDVQALRHRKGRAPYVINNRGLCGRFYLDPYTLDTYLTWLPCTRSPPRDDCDPELVGIFLRRLREDDQFIRVAVFGVDLVEHNSDALKLTYTQSYHTGFERDLSIRQRPLPADQKEEAHAERVHGFYLGQGFYTEDSIEPRFRVRAGSLDPDTRILSRGAFYSGLHNSCSIDIVSQECKIEMIHLGFDREYNPVVYLTTRDARPTGQHEKKESRTFAPWPRGSTDQPVTFGRDDRPQKYLETVRLKTGSKWWALMQPKVPGLWALKGDRIDGLDVTLLERPGVPVGRVALSRATVHGKKCWQLSIDDFVRLGEIAIYLTPQKSQDADPKPRRLLSFGQKSRTQ